MKPNHLKDAGLRPTFSRMSILKLFEATDKKHLTAEEIYQTLLKQGHQLGLASIYRVLTQFVHAGILVKHKCQDGSSIYELSQEEHHDHMVCIQCKRLIEFNNKEIETLKRQVAEEAGFVLSDHILYLYVQCQDPHCPHKQSADTQLSTQK